jgi:hypothetical protein
MRQLVEAMQHGKIYTFAEIVGLCQSNGCFDGIVGEAGTEVPNASRVKLSRLLGRYDHRLVKDCRFLIQDKGHKRRYHIEMVESDARSHAPHAVSVQAGKSLQTITDRKERAEHVERAVQLADAVAVRTAVPRERG